MGMHVSKMVAVRGSVRIWLLVWEGRFGLGIMSHLFAICEVKTCQEMALLKKCL